MLLFIPLIFNLSIFLVQTQFAFQPISGFSSKTYSGGMVYSQIRDSATYAYMSVRDNNTDKIIKWDLSNSSNPVDVGNYTYINQTQLFSYLYFVNSYILASGNLNKVRIFNQSSYAYIGDLSTNDVIGRAQHLSFSNTFVYGTSTGSIGYFNTNSLPNTINITYLSPSFSDFVFIQASPNQEYIVTSSKTSNIIRFWRTSDWILVKQTTGNSAGIYGHVWSPDSRYCYVHLFNQGKIEVYDKNMNFTKLYTIITNQSNVRTSFYYPETNVIVALSQSTNSIFTVNIDHNITTHYVYNFSGTFKMYPDKQMKSFTVCDGISTAWFFKIYPFCSTGTIYNSATISCDIISCPSDCFSCSNSTYCTNCNTNFNNANGSCIQCASATYFNFTNLVCASCSSNCSTCLNSTYCTTCSANFNNANGSCIQCLTGTYFNSTQFVCELCPNNCQQCDNSTFCINCSSGYNNAETNCVMCLINEYFNLTTLDCLSCQINCASCINSSFCLNCETDYNNVLGVCIKCQSRQFFNFSSYNCQSCQNNCLECSNDSYCTVCDNNFLLSNGNCLQSLSSSQQTDTFFQNVLSATISNEIIEYLNLIPGSRRILKQVFGFFINLDHFWLYIYHKREYGYYVNATLYAIKNLQDSKWNMISSETLTKAFSLNISNLQNEFTSKANYTSWKFMQVEKNQMSFFGNTLNYFILNVPLVLAMFLLMRFLFKLFFNFEISLLFRQYSFYAYLALMLVEGNVEQFLYLFVSELFTLFSFSFIDKISQILMIGFFFFFIFAIFSSYLIFKSTFNKLTKYFYDNCSNALFGAIYLTASNGVLNFCLGAVHRIFQDFYQLQLLSLGIIQTFYILFIISSLKQFKIFELYYIQWANFVTSFLRILLLITYYIDYNAPGESYAIQQTQRNIIIMYLLIWVLIMIANYCFLTFRFTLYLYNKYKISQKQDYQKYKYRNMVGFSPNAKQKILFQYISGQPQKKNKKKSLRFQILCDKIQQFSNSSMKKTQYLNSNLQKSSARTQFRSRIKTKQSQLKKNENVKSIAKGKTKVNLLKKEKTDYTCLTLIKKQNKKQIFRSMEFTNFA